MFIQCGKLNISLAFITHSYFSAPKDVRLNITYYVIVKINNKGELQNIPINNSPDIDYGDFVKIYRECTKKSYCFLIVHTSMLGSGSVRFRENLSLSDKNDSSWSNQDFK